MDQPNIAFPRYNLARVFKTRTKLAHDILTEFSGFVLQGAYFEDFVSALYAALPRVRRRVVWDSVRYLAGALLQDADLFAVAWRMSGNIDLLRTGVSVPPWSVQQAEEWMPVQVQAYQSGTDQRGRPGGLFTLRVLAGTACPLRISKFWTKRFCRMLASRMGYTRRRGEFPLGHISELVSLRLWIQVAPERCAPGVPGFEHVGVTSGLLNWNRAIIHKRYRRNWACPYDFDYRCHRCPVGYNDCPAATHKETLYDDETTDSAAGDVATPAKAPQPAGPRV